MSAGEVLEKELCLLPEGCRIGLRGHGRGGKRRRGEQSLVAAALSKIDAGVALLVREVGVALLLCFFSGRRDVCVCCLCFARAFTLSKSDASVPSINNTRSVSTMTTADSTVCIFYLETKILFTGSSILAFRIMRIAKKVDVYYFSFPTESPTSEKKIGVDTPVSSFRM